MPTVATSAPDPATILPAFVPSVLLADEKDSAPKHKPVTSLPRFPYWHPNSHQTTWILAVDLDHDDGLLRIFDAVQRGLPLPSWIMERGRNGHAQVAYVIERVSTGPTSRTHPQRYAHAVRHALTAALAGDVHFTNARMWNPWGWQQHGQVIWGHTAARSLGTLREQLSAAGLWTTPTRAPAPAVASRPAEGRNKAVFDGTRLRASGTVAEVAQALNAQFQTPMRPAEVAGIIRSIEGWEARHGRRGRSTGMSDEDRAKQQERGRAGGSRRTPAQQAQAAGALAAGPRAASVVRSAEAVGRAAQARALRDQGWTVARVAEELGVTDRTVRRLLNG